MKKILLIFTFISILTLTVPCAAAETANPVLITEGNKITVNNAVPNGTLILAFFRNGMLVELYKARQDY